MIIFINTSIFISIYLLLLILLERLHCSKRWPLKYEYIYIYIYEYIYTYTVSHRNEYTPHIFVNILLYFFM